MKGYFWLKQMTFTDTRQIFYFEEEDDRNSHQLSRWTIDQKGANNVEAEPLHQ